VVFKLDRMVPENFVDNLESMVGATSVGHILEAFHCKGPLKVAQSVCYFTLTLWSSIDNTDRLVCEAIIFYHCKHSIIVRAAQSVVWRINHHSAEDIYKLQLRC
jgi:hypothetical protein